jgi:hypothetical protein
VVRFHSFAFYIRQGFGGQLRYRERSSANQRIALKSIEDAESWNSTRVVRYANSR